MKDGNGCTEIRGTQKPNKHLNGKPTDSGDGWAHTVSSETLTRGTGCLNWARPGLRGLRVGDCPVLLGMRLLKEFLPRIDTNEREYFNRRNRRNPYLFVIIRAIRGCILPKLTPMVLFIGCFALAGELPVYRPYAR